MPRLSVLLTVALAMGLALAAAPVRADDGVDYAFDIRRPPDRWSMGDALRRPVLTGFDPGDPNVGLTLLAAYAPSPLLLVEALRPQAASHAFDAVELFVAAIGIAASSYGFTTSFARAPDAGLGIESLATAHALAWNLQLALLALVRLVFHHDPHDDERVPTFVPFTVDGGAGVVAQWQQ
ncbi:MAG: hypothetical protein U0234_11980 [Sandaracinus sp.]